MNTHFHYLNTVEKWVFLIISHCICNQTKKHFHKSEKASANKNDNIFIRKWDFQLRTLECCNSVVSNLHNLQWFLFLLKSFQSLMSYALEIFYSRKAECFCQGKWCRMFKKYIYINCFTYILYIDIDIYH